MVAGSSGKKCGLKDVIHSLEGLSGLHMLTKKKAEPKLRSVVWEIDILAVPEFVFDFNPALL